MNTVPHEFVTVDMRGLKAALIARAQEQRVSVSVVVRDALTKTLSIDACAAVEVTGTSMSTPARSLVKVSIRLTSDEAARFEAAANVAGLSRGAFLSGLLDGVTVLASGGRRDHLAALISSSSELATLSRNVRHLATLLRGAQVHAAQEYRSMLDTLAGDVEKHLRIVGEVLQHVRPSRRAPHGRRKADD